MNEKNICKCENCVYFNINKKDFSIKTSYTLVIASPFLTESEKEGLVKKIDNAFNKSGSCCRYPKMEYTSVDYMCGEYKEKK